MKVEIGMLALGAGALLCGCGGGGSSTAGSPQSTGFGDAKLTYSGVFKPDVLDYESGLSISAAAGLTISKLAMYPTQSNSNSPLYYVNAGVLYSYQRGASQPVFAQSDRYVFNADISNDGHIYFSTADPMNGYSIGRCHLDGTGYSTVFQAVYTSPIRVSSDGTKILFEDGSGLEVGSSTGGSKTLLDADGEEGCFSPDGTHVAYIKSDGANNSIYTIPVSGGTGTQLTGGRNCYFPTYNPDGTLILCDVDSGSDRYLESFYVSGPFMGDGLAYYFDSAGYTTGARYSPDGKYIAALNNPTYGGSPLQVTIEDLGGTAAGTAGTGNGISWPGFTPSRTFVGTGAVMSTTAAGFIYSQFQPGFASLVTFTATTPSTAKATLVTGSSTTGGPAMYDLHADSITGLKYSNGYWITPTSLTPSSTDALVSIDTTTGSVTSVAPYVVSRGESLTKTASATSLTYKAHFLGVWNAKGQNIAPQGATSLVLDNKHAGIISAQ